MQSDVFISYSRKDLDLVKQIKAEIGRSTGNRFWMDLDGIETGSPSFTKNLAEAINKCKVFLFMLSDNSQSSPYALRELNYAKVKQKEFGMHVVIVNIDNCQLNDEFILYCGMTDIILWTSIPQKEKLIKDLRCWVDTTDEEFKKYLELAKGYFYNKKQRQARYWASGSMLVDIDSYNEVFLTFTDDEVSRIKSLIIDDVNSCQITPQPVSTVKEALEVLAYGDLFDQNEELRKLLLERCEQSNLYPEEIDFDTKHYFYRFSCIAYDYKDNHTTDVIPVKILLSDEEYLALLSLQLEFRDNFTFNLLLRINPELALKLNNDVEGRIYGWRFPKHVPFMILFDEVRSDAELIASQPITNDAKQ